jgi:hypothetical protein
MDSIAAYAKTKQDPQGMLALTKKRLGVSGGDADRALEIMITISCVFTEGMPMHLPADIRVG